MNTQEFLEAIVPAGGNVVTAILRPDGKMAHVFSDTHAAAAGVVAAAASRGLTAYHACASYGPQEAGREGGNVLSVGALWLDMDVGPAKPYAKKSEAAIAVLNFAAKVGMPQPMLVDSGNGIHAYWRLASPVTPAEWLPVARALKAATVALGLGAGPERTADIASILRPAGSFNLKDPATPRPVKLALPGDPPQELTLYHTLLGVEDDPLADRPAHIQPGATLNAAFAAGDLGRSDAATVEDVLAVCGQLRAMRDEPEKQGYAAWYGTLGILAYCEDGDDKAHEWGLRHPGYRRVQTQKFLDKWRTLSGGTTCAKLKGDNPAGCAGCTFSGKSPLGAPRAQEIVVNVLADGTKISQFVRQSVEVPRGYNVTDQGIVHQVKDEAGAVGYELICHNVFRPIATINTSTVPGLGLGHHIEFEVVYKKNDATEHRSTFTVPADTIAKQQGFIEAIGKHLIYPVQNKERAVHEYAKAYVTKLHADKADIPSINHFGWHGNDFVVGRTVYKEDGTADEAVLMDSAKVLGQHLGPMSEDAQAWVDAVDQVMQLEGNEAMQFALLCSLAAPLWQFSHDALGVMVHYYSPASGRGKTTSHRIALSAWGRQDKMMLSGNGATPNAFITTVSTYSNLPIAYDELTSSKTFTPMDLLYRVSEGSEKIRLTAGSVLKENLASWRTVVLSTANNSMSAQIQGEMGNTTGGRARLFEVRMGERAEVPDALRVFGTIYENGGSISPIYAPYLVANREVLTNEVLMTRGLLENSLGFVSEERNWCQLFASVLVAYKHAYKLGIVRFPSKGLVAWMTAKLVENRSDLGQQRADYMDLFSTYLNSISQSWLVTEGIGNAVKIGDRKDGHVIKDPTRELLVRVVYPEAVGEPAYFLIAQATIEAWCKKASVDIKELRGLLKFNRVLITDNDRDRLGKGVPKWASGGKTKNWKIDLSAIIDARSAGNLTLVAGGKK